MKSNLFAIPLALAICVSACYGQETETSSDTQDFAKEAKMLHGAWAGDSEKTAEEIKDMEGMDEAMVDMVIERVKLINVHFHDGTFAVEIAGEEMKGTWEVTAAEEKDDMQTIKIHVMPDEDSVGEEKHFEIHCMGETHIKMIDQDGGPPIVLKRADEEMAD
ncbi:MAG: hypothetical protein ACR2NP_13360 [Pirellulaceae bacterium]